MELQDLVRISLIKSYFGNETFLCIKLWKIALGKGSFCSKRLEDNCVEDLFFFLVNEWCPVPQNKWKKKKTGSDFHNSID